MAWIRSRNQRRDTGEQRRSGPVHEEVWWDPADQALAERALLDRRRLGRGWLSEPMLNNSERRHPFGDEPAAVRLTKVRAGRRPTALDEGQAWRHRDRSALLVLRCDVYADPDVTSHRTAWQTDGEAVLEAIWRARWRERDREPGWVEARVVPVPDRPETLPGATMDALDWFRVEDHTAPGGDRAVAVYEHLTVWSGRIQVTATIRHTLGLDLDDMSAHVANEIVRRLASYGRSDLT